MIDFESLDKIRDTIIIRKGILITYKELKKLREYPMSFLNQFIEKSYTINQKGEKFIIEDKCSECGKINILELSRNKLSQHLNPKNEYICDECLNKIKQKQLKDNPKDIKTLHNELIEQSKIATDRFIKEYLNPDRKFLDSVKNKFSSMRYSQLYNLADKNEIAEYIKEMDYQDFLNTPYWDAVRSKKLYEAHFKCQLCGKSDTRLNVHHNSYERHGYEAEYYKEDLIVLCDECHEKFHNEE